jgi:hypothetical protein
MKDGSGSTATWAIESSKPTFGNCCIIHLMNNPGAREEAWAIAIELTIDG